MWQKQLLNSWSLPMSVQILTQKLCIKCLSLGKMSIKIIHRGKEQECMYLRK